MKRVISTILFVVYSIIAITVTILLLSYNDYNISEVGNYTVYIAKDDLFEPRFEEGSIIIIEGSSDRNIAIGDEVFVYQVYNSQEFQVTTKVIQNKMQHGRSMLYTVEGGENYSSDYVIGKVKDTTVIGSPWGTVLSILESKWGYLFCIVIVSLLLFLQEVFDLIIEIKYGSGKAKNKGATKGANASKATASKKTTTKTASTVKNTATTAKTVAKTVAATTQLNNESLTGEKEG